MGASLTETTGGGQPAPFNNNTTTIKTTTTMKAISPRKKWFTSKKEAFAAYEQRKNSISVDGVYRQKEGRHKGQYFVGNYIEFINRY